MRIEEDLKLDYSDVLIRPKRSELTSRKEVQVIREIQFRNGDSWLGCPIVAANMDTVGTPEMGIELTKHNMITCLSKYVGENRRYDVHEKENNIAISFGMTQKDRDNLLGGMMGFTDFIMPYRFICLDVANGYTQKFVDYVKEVREEWPEKTIIAGNVATAEMTEALLLAGADIVKVGIGPGSVCTTRKITGVGYPQLSAVIECADAAHGIGGHIMADGGCQSPGDVAKAFCAGADFVMLGGMLAGHDECAGDIEHCIETGEDHMVFYGMSSDTAMNKHSGGVATYRASEGKTVRVPYRGPVKNTIQQILGGVRSCATYIGASSIKDMPKCATFVKVNRQLNTVFGNE